MTSASCKPGSRRPSAAIRLDALDAQALVTTAALLRLGSSVRARPVAETLELGARLMSPLGISRVTDVTRMDRLGLPVCVSIRPRGRALCVHAGKGLRLAEARVGALMEAVEFAVAEPQRTDWTSRSLRLDQLVAHWADEISLFDLAPMRDQAVPPGRLVEAIRCEDVAGGRPLWLPAELIFVPFEVPGGELLCGWSTNGLASGNTLGEATLHGLLEVLERDALAMNTPFDATCWIEPSDLPQPFRELAQAWRAIGVELSVRYVPNDFGLPCFDVLLREGEGAVVDLAAGHGLHLDPHIALARAVCEAAQSRLSHIHGGRDDITRFYDEALQTAGAGDPRESRACRAAFDTRRRIAWADVPAMAMAGASVDEVLAGLLERLRALGFSKVLRHRFALELGGLHVVKVVVPRCQEIDAPWRRLGRRLYEKVLAHA